ncbi:trihelix transcription factor ASR3-like isoform X1 [Juglans microcarpa x Juglans regia]|uniref:trihelix transcription factor ASR3-like isoform X1 n=1 Tax=Juglans microcarpa x Juglans regia TaxID=2249226 RepID=UPI001B7F4A5B|nr:trihelix transcription factor ASR3-like isoform X1 [Juglans microcarpa x Juglans regia]
MAEEGGNSIMRDYRKGNWTPSETMILIEAKKMDDERRMKRSGESEGRNKSVEPRWKWVEDYCWRKGCLRSQNQCNDKWDNLMRDYKKVRDYERRIAERAEAGDEESYWKIERNERKERSLPTNMSPQIYDVLVEVVERKGTAASQRMVGGVHVSTSNPNLGFVVERPVAMGNIAQPSLPPLLQHHISTTQVPPLALPGAAAPPPLLTVPALTYSQPMPTIMRDSSDPDTSEHSDSPAKRRRKEGDQSAEGTSGTANTSTSHEVGTAISKSASIIAEAIQASEEREERRHRELLSMHERRLKIEESKKEINREGIVGLVDAINKLADSINALASHKNHQSPPK